MGTWVGKWWRHSELGLARVEHLATQRGGNHPGVNLRYRWANFDPLPESNAYVKRCKLCFDIATQERVPTAGPWAHGVARTGTAGIEEREQNYHPFRMSLFAAHMHKGGLQKESSSHESSFSSRHSAPRP